MTDHPLGQGVTGLSLDLLAERIDAEWQLRETREAAAKEALSTATTALDKRLDGMNEFRATLRDQSSQFMSRQEYEGKHEALSNRITQLERSSERSTGAIGAVRFLVVLVGAPGIAALLWVLAAAFSGHSLGQTIP